MHLLVTGTTGTLGPHVLANIAPFAEKVYVLVRAESLEKARQMYAHFPNVICFEGDLAHPDLFTDAKAGKEVLENTQGILHMAARYELNATHAECFLHNVVGTQNVLYFANACKKPVHFHYISTIAVAGDYEGEFPESQLDMGQSFANHYAKTKYEAEMVVRHWKLAGAKSIYRLGIVVGDSNQGNFVKLDGPYYFMRALAQIRSKRPLINALKYLPMPYDRKAVLPMVPVNLAGQFIAQAVLHPAHSSGTRCYHVVSDGAPTVGRFLQDAFDAFGYKISVVPLPDTRVNDLLMEKIGLPKQLLDYLYSGAKFPSANLRPDYPAAELGHYDAYKKIFYDGAMNAFKNEGKPKRRSKETKA